MRAALAFLLLIPLMVPAVAADSEQGATVGVNLGYIAPGLWDAYWYQHPGGGASFSLSWAPSMFPGADYDLHLYVPTALNDGYLSPTELIIKSNQRTFAPHVEGFSLGLAAARYVVAVVPFQTQAETYTVSTAGGDLAFAAVAVGYITYS